MSVRIAIYADRLEVENPGGWPIGFSEADFKAGISRVRNPVIARVLHELDVIERWGSGYLRIREAGEAGGYPLPTWHEAGPVLRVRLRPHPEVVRAAGSHPVTEDDRVNDRVNDTVNDRVSEALNDRQRWMLLELAQGRPVAAADLMERYQISESTARRDIAGLRKQNLIAFEGSPKTGRYVLLQGGSRPDTT